MNTTNNAKQTVPTHHARVLSPSGVYPAECFIFDDSAYIRDDELSFSVCCYTKHINCIDLNDALVIRGLTTLKKAVMLHFHYQFFEAAIYSLFISMEVSFRLVVRALKAKGFAEPTSKDAMTYIHDAFFDIHRVEKYFEEYYDGRIMTFHPQSRYGVYPHAPLAADDYYFLFNDMLEVYAFLICGSVHPKLQVFFIYVAVPKNCDVMKPGESHRILGPKDLESELTDSQKFRLKAGLPRLRFTINYESVYEESFILEREGLRAGLQGL